MSLHSFLQKRSWRLLVPALFLFIGYSAFTHFATTIHVPLAGNAPDAVVGERVPFLKAPEGFEVTYYAKGIKGARVMEFDPHGRMIVSQTSEGMISIISGEDNGGVTGTVRTLIEGLDSPHGLAIRCKDDQCSLYVATQSALFRFAYNAKLGDISDKEKLLDFDASATDRHKTRTLMFLGSSRDDMLLISVGSSCDVCQEKSDMHGRILSYNIRTGELSEYARGLRNAVFMTLNPNNDLVFMTEMGRDGLGDKLPPDEVNYIDPASRAEIDTPPNFGWPLCYGKNIHDTNYDKNTYIRNPCMFPSERPSWLDLEAHSAPLGLAFIPKEGWPEDWRSDLIIAEHGSWNRSDLVGYKIVKLNINGRGEPSDPEDLITGWLTPYGEKLGRPADVKIRPGGTMYISDDYTGLIYRLLRVR